MKHYFSVNTNQPHITVYVHIDRCTNSFMAIYVDDTQGITSWRCNNHIDNLDQSIDYWKQRSLESDHGVHTLTEEQFLSIICR
jgi:hypothetical protein